MNKTVKSVEQIEKEIESLYKALDQLGWSRTILTDKQNKIIDNFMVVGDHVKITKFLEDYNIMAEKLYLIKKSISMVAGNEVLTDVEKNLEMLLKK